MTTGRMAVVVGGVGNLARSGPSATGEIQICIYQHFSRCLPFVLYCQILTLLHSSCTAAKFCKFYYLIGR